MNEPNWLAEHRSTRPYVWTEGNSALNSVPHAGNPSDLDYPPKLLADNGFNSHELNDGKHVSPYDQGQAHVGTYGLQVRLIQGIDEQSFRRVLSLALRATTGIAPGEELDASAEDAEEMMKGGLQAALETQTIVFQVTGASRALTHQLVRSRKAGFHQQSQRATFYGDRPNFRMPLSAFRDGEVRELWDQALLASWNAYRAACDAGISYQDARYILPEGTENYILCEYTILEFINVFAYRGCSMFLWEMVDCMRKMRSALIAAHPFLAPHIKISCEKGPVCETCSGKGTVVNSNPDATWGVDLHRKPCEDCGGLGGKRKCTFQGWENVENVCDFPWAKQDNRVFLPSPKNRIGG